MSDEKPFVVLTSRELRKLVHLLAADITSDGRATAADAGRIASRLFYYISSFDPKKDCPPE